MLIRIIYISNAVATQTANTTQAILQKAQDTNLANGITGVLCQGQGVYLQALEGERSTVTQLYARIYADKRHANVEMIHCESIAKRRYENWSMAHVSLSDVDPETKIVWPEFDPYSLTGLLVMARIDDLLASGTVIVGSTSIGLSCVRAACADSPSSRVQRTKMREAKGLLTQSGKNWQSLAAAPGFCTQLAAMPAGVGFWPFSTQFSSALNSGG